LNKEESDKKEEKDEYDAYFEDITLEDELAKAETKVNTNDFISKVNK
jgi:hypothetical protein